jgi:hypothetical protein
MTAHTDKNTIERITGQSAVPFWNGVLRRGIRAAKKLADSGLSSECFAVRIFVFFSREFVGSLVKTDVLYDNIK